LPVYERPENPDVAHNDEIVTPTSRARPSVIAPGTGEIPNTRQA